MTCEGIYPSAALGQGPALNDPPWILGRTLAAPVPQPLLYRLNPERLGNLRAMYDSVRYPIMRDDLIAALQAVGVDNLQLFDAVLVDPSTGAEHRNYKAFNIIGLVAATDFGKSVLAGTSESRVIDVEFDRLAIDEAKAAPFRLFRLAENASTIIVDEVVKAEVERRAIPGMLFYEPNEWSG
jgi:Immunity protein family (Imm11)